MRDNKNAYKVYGLLHIYYIVFKYMHIILWRAKKSVEKKRKEQKRNETQRKPSITFK